MNIQSLSICVPSNSKGIYKDTCINKCEFCVSRMHTNTYKNMISGNTPFYDLYIKDYIKRLEFARDNGCNTVMITGCIEPLQNKDFLKELGLFFMIMKNPFKRIELQTSGVLLDEQYLRFLRNHVGVDTISLSLSSFDDWDNHLITHSPSSKIVRISKLCELIKKYDFTLRLSLNMTNKLICEIANTETLVTVIQHLHSSDIDHREIYLEKLVSNLINKCKELGADQVTLRMLYADKSSNTPQAKWVEENSYGAIVHDIKNYIHFVGEGINTSSINVKVLERLEYGALKYDVEGISMVIDTDCMSKELSEDIKYVILREDCKLYTKWDSKASLLF